MRAAESRTVRACAPGGTTEKFKGCVEFALPMTATVGGRYKFLDADGMMNGDLELNVDWQNWAAERASNYRVVVDAQVRPRARRTPAST